MNNPSDNTPIALFDMDGTLFDYDGAVSAAMEKLRSPDEPPLNAQVLSTRNGKGVTHHLNKFTLEDAEWSTKTTVVEFAPGAEQVVITAAASADVIKDLSSFQVSFE